MLVGTLDGGCYLPTPSTSVEALDIFDSCTQCCHKTNTSGMLQAGGFVSYVPLLRMCLVLVVATFLVAVTKYPTEATFKRFIFVSYSKNDTVHHGGKAYTAVA